MAFTAIFYTFAKRINSTQRPNVSGIPANIEFKDASDILRPEISLYGISGPHVLNYCYIQEFDRYYWVENWHWLNGRWSASLRVDVLASYKTEIGASTQYVLRSASQYDGRITDGYYPKINAIEEQETVVTTNRPLTPTIANGYYIVGLISSEDSIGCISYYILNQTNFNLLKTTLFSDISWTNVYDISGDLLKTMFNPYDYIVSCKWCPITSLTSLILNDQVSSIKIGWWDFQVSAYKIRSNANLFIAWSFDLPKAAFGAHPQAAARGNYLNNDPYAEYNVNIAPYGCVRLPTDSAMAGVTVNENIDIITGECEIKIFYGAGSSATVAPLLCVKSAMLVDIQLAQVKPDNNLQSIGINALASGALKALSYIPGSSPIKNTISGVVEATREQNITVTAGSPGGGFARIAMFANFNAAVTSIFQYVTPDDVTHFGRPLCQTKVINTLTGLVVCGDPDIKITGTAEESDEILRYMENGFYYE